MEVATVWSRRFLETNTMDENLATQYNLKRKR